MTDPDNDPPNDPKDLYLIAHKVRGHPTYDVANQIPCARCRSFFNGEEVTETEPGCPECDFTGHWWITSTYGHRAYPFWYTKLDDVLVECAGEYESVTYGIDEMPADLPEHFRAEMSRLVSTESGLSQADKLRASEMLTALGLRKAPEPIRRRLAR